MLSLLAVELRDFADLDHRASHLRYHKKISTSNCAAITRSNIVSG